MPELPEVETIRQDLEKKILNTKIVQVVVYNKKSVGGDSNKFVRALKGHSFIKINRRGKLMIFRLDQGSTSLLVHLKMTGQLIYERELKNKVDVVAGGHKLSVADIENLPNKHTRVAFVFANGGQLFFNDLRIFGYMKLASVETVENVLKKFGPEPLSPLPGGEVRAKSPDGASPLFGVRGRSQGETRMISPVLTFDYFSNLFKKRQKTTVKAMLLNQELIAGLGNIYVDEVCWCAGIMPSRRVGTVTKAEQKKLFACIPKILKEAIKHRGTTFRNFLDASGRKGNYTDFLKVYDRDGKKCQRCGAIIKKIKTAGRGTHFCPKCQK